MSDDHQYLQLAETLVRALAVVRMPTPAEVADGKSALLAAYLDRGLAPEVAGPLVDRIHAASLEFAVRALTLRVTSARLIDLRKETVALLAAADEPERKSDDAQDHR